MEMENTCKFADRFYFGVGTIDETVNLDPIYACLLS